ncbi:MAG TPA: tetratricopeptide repeat protein [Candidatus Nanopelagicales bacterium]
MDRRSPAGSRSAPPSRGGSGGGRPGPGRVDDRSERSPRREGPPDPHIPDDIEATSLDRVTRNSLRTLPDGLAEIVARHLVAAAAVLADDPELALAHARAASRRAGRVAVVREAVGVAAYAAGEYGAALTELRAAARISGSSEYLPMMADCERGLGRPEKALALASAPEASTLDRDGKVELLIVAAGARRDLGQPDAAVLTLQVPALQSRAKGDWLARLRYAYADALLDVGRTEEAVTWFARAVEVDPEGITDAAERLDELAGVTFEDVLDDQLDDLLDEEAHSEATGGPREDATEHHAEPLDEPGRQPGESAEG